jgi:hypothetical protein
MIKSKLNVIYNNARAAKEVVTEHETKADMARYFNWLVSKGHKITHVEHEYIFNQTELLLQAAAEELGDEHTMYHLIQQHLSDLKSNI